MAPAVFFARYTEFNPGFSSDEDGQEIVVAGDGVIMKDKGIDDAIVVKIGDMVWKSGLS